jgi:hypothetical protein
LLYWGTNFSGDIDGLSKGALISQTHLRIVILVPCN